MIRDKDLMHFDPNQKQVTFRYRQSKSGQYRYRTLPLDEFLWRITMQVLPKGFRRVRDYGLLVRGRIERRLHVWQRGQLRRQAALGENTINMGTP